MTEECQHTTKEEIIINNIQEELINKFSIETEYIGDGKLGIEEFNGYIDSEEQFDIIEDLAENLCGWLRVKFDNDFDYQPINEGYEITIQMI